MHTIGRGPGYVFALFAVIGIIAAGCGTEFDEAPPDAQRRQGAVVCLHLPPDRGIHDTVSDLPGPP